MEQTQLIWWTAVAGVGSALATGLGALPVALIRRSSRLVRAFASAVAAGMMISASVFSLAQEGISLQATRPSAPFEVIGGLLLGAAFFWAVSRLFSRWGIAHEHPADPGEDDPEETEEEHQSRTGLLIFCAMLIHSAPEGVAIGVGFATGDYGFGLIMALAISIHNVPEGIAISLPLRAGGASLLRCTTMSVLSSVPQPLLAVPAALAVWFFQPLLASGLGFAGGAMIYLVVHELIPEALEDGGKSLTAWGVMVGLAGMLLLTTLLDLVEV